MREFFRTFFECGLFFNNSSNTPKRLSKTHFPAEHDHKANISTSKPTQNTSAVFPCTHRPNIFAHTTKYSSAMLPRHPTNSLATTSRPRLPAPAFSDAATDLQWLSRTTIYSLDPCSIQNMALPRERAFRPWLQQITTANAPERLPQTHFAAEHAHRASVSTSEPTQNTSAVLPCTSRPNIFTQITKNSLERFLYF